MKINEVEKQTGISSTNIRYYEQKELLVPQRSSENNYRVYSPDDIERLKQIKILRMIGIPISEIKEILDGTKSLKDVMNVRISELAEEEKTLSTITTLCKTIVEQDMDIHMLTEELLEESKDLWKKKLTIVNIEERAQYLHRKSMILLCILGIIFCFFPVVPVYDTALSCFQLILHPGFVWTPGIIFSLLLYLIIPVIYIYVLHGHLYYRNNVEFLIYPTLATSLGVFSQILIVLIVTLQMPHFVSSDHSMPLFLCTLSAFLRFLAGFLLVIDCASGEELFVRILKKRAGHS